MHNEPLRLTEEAKLRPIVATSSADAAVERVRISPLLWPLVAYLGLGTVLLFGVSQLEGLAVAIQPGPGTGRKWHELSAGWMALYPIAIPLLLVRVAALLAVAIPGRMLSWLWRAAQWLGRALRDAWTFVRSVVTRALQAAVAMVNRLAARMRVVLREAMRTVRRTSEETVRRVRAALARD